MNQAVSRKISNWYVPPDLVVTVILPLVVCLGGLLVIQVLILLKQASLFTLVSSGCSLGLLGILLLFVARWPLYRQHRFWTIGPRQLPRLYRRIYGLAYAAIIPAVVLLAVVWFRTR